MIATVSREILLPRRVEFPAWLKRLGEPLQMFGHGGMGAGVFAQAMGGAGVAAAWVPTDKTGLLAWYSATREVGLSDGSACLPQDQSGNAKHMTQADSGLRPLWKTTYYDWDGTDDTTSVSLGALAAPFTFFALVYFDNLSQPAGNYDYLLNLGAGIGAAGSNASISREVISNRYYSFNGSDIYLGTALTGQSYLAIVARHNSSATFHNVRVNGTGMTVSDYPASISTNGLLTISRLQGIWHPFDGRIKDLGVYNSYLSDPETLLLEAYLASL